MRYEFAPAGVAPDASNEFYIYVSHYKSGGSSYNSDRAGEAQIIRTNEAVDLPATARVLYVGDYNITTSGDPSYQIIVSNAAPNGIRQGAGVDPFNPANNQSINWHSPSAGTNILAQESDNCEFIQYRDDLEMMTTNVYFGATGGLKYRSGNLSHVRQQRLGQLPGHGEYQREYGAEQSGDERAGFYFCGAIAR